MFFFLIPFTSSSSSFVMFWQNLWYLAKYLARKWFSFSIFFDRPITDHSLESALSAQQLVLLKESTGTICAYLYRMDLDNTHNNCRVLLLWHSNILHLLCIGIKEDARYTVWDMSLSSFNCTWAAMWGHGRADFCGGNSWVLLGFRRVYSDSSEPWIFQCCFGTGFEQLWLGQSWCSDTSSRDGCNRYHWHRNIIILYLKWPLCLHLGCKESFWDSEALVQLLGLLGFVDVSVLKEWHQLQAWDLLDVPGSLSQLLRSGWHAPPQQHRLSLCPPKHLWLCLSFLLQA